MVEEEAQAHETLKIKPTCSTTARGWGWGGEQAAAEPSPTQDWEDEVVGGEEEEGQLSPQVRLILSRTSESDV